MSTKSDETLRKVSYAVLALGIVLGIAGVVMLIIGISKKNNNCIDDGSSTISTPATSPSGCYPTGDQLNPFFVDASSSKVTWDPTMKDTSSPAFAAAQKALVTEISDAFNSTGSVQETRGGKYSKAATPTNRLIKVTVNMITNGTGTGVNYYATMIFVNDGTSNPLNVSSVQDMLNNAGIPSAASGNPTDQCHSVNLPPTLPPSGPTSSTLASSSITTSVPVDTSSIPTTLPTAATSPGCTPPPSTNNPPSGCSGDSFNPFSITAYTNSISWDPTMSDPSSLAYQSAVKKLSDQITATFSNSTTNNFKRFLMMATNSATYTLQKVSISQIANPSATSANAPSTGVNFYATLVFVGVPGPSEQDIQNHLSTASIYATAYSSTTAGQCSAYPPPPYPTGPPPPSSSPRPPLTCDPTTSKTSVIFLVDAASPTEPGINSTIKQQLIASYLQSFMPSTTSDSWPGLQMGVAIYYGTTAYMPNNFMCNNGACWANTVNSIVVQSSNPSISAYDSHNVSSGLLFAINEFSLVFGNNDPYGTARLAVLVTDGYQYNGNAVDPAPGLATTLKNAGFKLTAVVATPSPSVQNSIKALVSVDWSDSFPLASITQLTNPTLLTYTTNWVCAAFPITTPAPPVTTTTTITTTTTYTLPQLTITSTPPPTTGPPQPPTLPPNSPCRNLDFLFLIDESQSMAFNSGFEFAKSFIANVTDMYEFFPNSRFAWITFNSKIWAQTPFMAAQDFKANVTNTIFMEGSTNFVLGFNAANYTISTNSGPTQQRQPVLIFVSDGNPNDGGAFNQVVALTTYLRCNLNTLIIGLGVSEALTDAQTMKDAIGVGAPDKCTMSHYGDISNYAQIPIAGLPQVEQYLNCYPASPATSNCNLDIMFVFENSELVDYAGRDLELGAINKTISDYGMNGSLSYDGDHIGIVYFSSIDGFNGAEYNRSGILDDPANSNPASTDYLQALSLLNSFNSTYQLGGASDVLLGLNMTSQLLAYRRNVDYSANIPAIIIMGRGTFRDSGNCCDSPVAFAQNLRAQYGAQMKGVLVGQLSSDSILSSITGTSNIVPSQDYYNDGSAFNDGMALSSQISGWLESVRKSASCPLPTQLPYCPYYMDIVIIWRTATQNQTFQDVQKFITQLLLAPGTGTFAGAEQNTVTDRLTRIALITYDTNQAKLKFDLTQYQYMSDYSNAVGSMPWPNQASLTADLLSEAFKAAQEVLLNSARLYASRSVIVFSDDFSSSDYNDTISNYHLLKDVLDASVFGIYIGQNQSDSFDYRNFTDQRIALPFSTGLNPTKPSAINVANALRNFVCAVSPPPPPPPTTPPTTTTQAPCTYPPPPTPSTSAQPTKAPAGAWPDITILLDTSANLAPGSYALNDRGFEAVRMFLVNTLQQYRIDFNHTRVSLVTFDGTANVVFTFNQNLNMASLMNAIGNQWEYGPAGTHTADRNLNAALQMLLTNVYNEPSGSGYDPNHINFLWAFVTGNPTDKGYAQSLYQLQSMGIRTQAIGLGALDQQFLSNFGFDSFDYASPFDPVSGIASPTSPLPHMLYQQTTVYITPPPTLAQVSADIVIVIEESTQLTPGNFINVKGFLTQFFTHLQFGPTGSSVALFSYNNRSLLGWTLNSGNDKAGVLNIASKLSYQNSNISTPNINAALDSLYSIYLNASTGYQNRSTFVIFLTSSSTVSPDLDAGKALLVRQMATVFAIDIGGNNTTPEYFERLTGDVDHNGFSVSGPGALWNWINKPLINGTNPMNTFFQQLIAYQQNYVYNHPVLVTQIMADFIFAIDQTLLTQANFTSIQNYLVNLTAQMTISPQYAQIGVIVYSGTKTATAGFALNSNNNYTQLRNAINGLSWTDSAGQTTSDIAAAYHFISNVMLRPAQGWRYGPTFVIVLSSAFNSTLYNGTYNNAEIQHLDSMAHLYGISLNGYGTGSQGFLTHYCQTVVTVSSPTALTIASAASMNLISTIDSQYKTDRFPPLPPLSSVQADFIFVIDQSKDLFASDFAAIKTFLTTFVMMWDSQNIGINGSQLAVVSYNSQGILMQSSFALNSYTNGKDLVTAIGNLPPVSSMHEDSDIAKAIQYVNSYSLSANQGRRWWKPAFVTFISVAQKLTNPLDQSQIDMLNANSQTFGFDYFEYPATFQYLAQITGNIDLVERISDFDFSKPAVQNYLSFVEYIWRDWSNSNSKRR